MPLFLYDASFVRDILKLQLPDMLKPYVQKHTIDRMFSRSALSHCAPYTTLLHPKGPTLYTRSQIQGPALYITELFFPARS